MSGKRKEGSGGEKYGMGEGSVESRGWEGSVLWGRGGSRIL